MVEEDTKLMKRKKNSKKQESICGDKSKKVNTGTRNKINEE